MIAKMVFTTMKNWEYAQMAASRKSLEERFSVIEQTAIHSWKGQPSTKGTKVMAWPHRRQNKFVSGMPHQQLFPGQSIHIFNRAHENKTFNLSRITQATYHAENKNESLQ